MIYCIDQFYYLSNNCFLKEKKKSKIEVLSQSGTQDTHNHSYMFKCVCPKIVFKDQF